MFAKGCSAGRLRVARGGLGPRVRRQRRRLAVARPGRARDRRRRADRRPPPEPERLVQAGGRPRERLPVRRQARPPLRRGQAEAEARARGSRCAQAGEGRAEGEAEAAAAAASRKPAFAVAGAPAEPPTRSCSASARSSSRRGSRSILGALARASTIGSISTTGSSPARASAGERRAGAPHPDCRRRARPAARGVGSQSERVARALSPRSRRGRIEALLVRLLREQRGYSLMELLVSMTILGAVMTSSAFFSSAPPTRRST